MFCWMDPEEIKNQFSKNKVKPDDLKVLLERERSLKRILRKIRSFGIEDMMENREFAEEFEKYTAKKENCKKIFDFIKTKTTIKQVFVYPIKEHLEHLEHIPHVLSKYDPTDLIPTPGVVWTVEGGKPRLESWKNLIWGEKNGLLIEVAGIVGTNGCFYPFERPTNSTVSLRFGLDSEFKDYCIGDATQFETLHDIYSLIIGKVIFPHTIKPIFFTDLSTHEGKKEMGDHLTLWYKIFFKNIFKELYGYEKPKGDKVMKGIVSNIGYNRYRAGEWIKTEQKIPEPLDYIWIYDNANQASEVGHETDISKSLKLQRMQTEKREKFKCTYNIWRCEGYERTFEKDFYV